ncbi:MAG: ParB/Srx family N-terminal domain-containing protein [Sedimenticolaceae bacterium]
MKKGRSTTGLLVVGMALMTTTSQAGPFDASLASCARTVEFCDKLSYDKDLCKKAREKLPDCDENTGSGVLCRLKLKDIAPTQVSVGAQATHCKAKAKFQQDEKTIQKYLLKSTHHVPTVIGPANGAGKQFYITDHHHLSHALMVANTEKYTDVDSLYACILTNRKEDKTDDFWSFMVGNHLTWLDDENGKALSPTELEKLAPDLKDLKNDAYRTWSRWVRDSCGYVKAGNDCVPTSYPAGAAYFMEFLWADYLEQNMPGHEKIDKLSDKEITELLEQAITLAQGPQAFLENLPGYSDGTVVPVKMVEIKDGCEKD